MACAVKVMAFDWQKHGLSTGVVSMVAPFTRKDEAGDTGFPILAALASATLPDGSLVRPGMAAEIEVPVGRRRVIELFLFPLIEHLDRGVSVR